ncbi:MAG: hypothetical protein WEE89_15945 [Gemmatimonadota bacterium]
MTFLVWRRVHRLATGTIALFAALHSVLTFLLYETWSPDSVWFLGTGLGLLLLAAMNWSHVGLEPCDLPTAPVIRWANVCFVLFGVGAVLAVAEPQAFLILAALVIQAAAGFVTLRPRNVTLQG